MLEKTKIIPQNMGTTPLGWTYQRVSEILVSEAFRKIMKHPHDITNRLPGYSIVTNNKFPWLWNAIEENPFDTEFFFWMDAGLSRFFTNVEGYSLWNGNINSAILSDLHHTKRIYAVIGGGKEEYIHSPDSLTVDDIIGDNVGFIMTGFFGGNAETLRELCSSSMKTFIVEMIQKGRIDHDQCLIYLHFQKNKDKYLLVPPHPHLNYHNFFIMFP